MELLAAGQMDVTPRMRTRPRLNLNRPWGGGLVRSSQRHLTRLNDQYQVPGVNPILNIKVRDLRGAEYIYAIIVYVFWETVYNEENVVANCTSAHREFERQWLAN
jgi:hypothetical protein